MGNFDQFDPADAFEAEGAANHAPPIQARKDEHIAIVSTGRGTQTTIQTGFDDIRFEHLALPEIDFDPISTETEFLGVRLAAPILISAMTGGAKEAENINHHIAKACHEVGIAMSVGSQRIALRGESRLGLDKSLRKTMGNLPILGNLGAVQLNYGLGIDDVKRAIDMIEADAMVLHLNALQEAIQTGGDRNFSGLLAKIEALVQASPVPIGIKEVGAGLSVRVGQRLLDMGVQMIDVAGAGGTSWSRVEGERGGQARRKLAEPFHDWGIPTARAVVDMAEILPEGRVLIASGGVRDGLDVARSIRLGAHLAGQAAGVLTAARQSTGALIEHLNITISQLKIAMFCTGSMNLDALKTAPLIDSLSSKP